MFLIKKICIILRFVKIEHTVFSLPLVFVGALFGMNGSFPDISVMLFITCATIGARVFGMVFNRIFDRKIDALNFRTSNRELVSGVMKVDDALIVALLGIIVYLVSCVCISKICFFLSPLPLFPLFFYSFLKRFTFLCHFGVGFCLALAPLCAFVAVSGHVYFTLPVILFSLFVFFWLSGADIIYAMMDVDIDRVIGVCSLPARFGVFYSKLIAAGLHIIAVIFMMVIVLILDGGFFSWLAFVVVVITIMLTHVTFIPLQIRFFPLSAIVGVVASIVPFLAYFKIL